MPAVISRTALSPARRRIRTATRLGGLVLVSPLVLGALLWLAGLLTDANVVPSALAASARESTVMLCTEGAMRHGDGSLTDRLLNPGTFVCSAWRMRGRQNGNATGAVSWPSSPRR